MGAYRVVGASMDKYAHILALECGARKEQSRALSMAMEWSFSTDLHDAAD